MKKNLVGQCVTALFCTVFGRLVDATCFTTDNPSSACRYPAGDAWCARNGGGYRYAYKDGCVDEQEPAETQMTTRPPAPVAPWKPIAVWDCERARTPVEHLICAAPDVHAQDVRMGALYSELQARGLAPEQMQKAWLKKQREACNTLDCLRAVYAERIRHLENLLATDAAEAPVSSVPIAPAAPPPPKTTAPATRRPPAPATPANLDVEDAAAATAAALMPALSAPQSFPASAIPQLPLPELYSPATTGAPPASPKSAPKVFWIAVSAVVLAMALGLFVWLGRSRTNAIQQPYLGLPALWRRLGVQRQPRARSESLRLDAETLARLSQLRRPGESAAEVLARALAALEAAPDPAPVAAERLDTLEARLQRLEGSMKGVSPPGTTHESVG